MERDQDTRRLDRRQFLKIASLAGGGVFLVACAPAALAPTATPAPKTAPTSPTAAPPPKVSASIDFAATAGGIGVHMMPALVAQELFLKDEGITQKLTVFSGGGDTVRGVVTGGQQIGHPAPNAVAIAAAEAQPVRIIAQNLPFATIFWIVKQDSPLKSMKDLKGKKLGYSRPGSVSQTYAFTALRALGLEPDKDVQLVAAGGGPDQMTAVKGGVIDVGWTTDPLVTQELLKKEIRILASSNEFIPMWSESMITTTEDYAKANGDVLRAYLRAHEKALNYIKSNSEKAAEIWAKGQEVTAEVAKTAIKNYPIEKLTSRIEPAILKAISDDMLANKQIKEAPAWNKIVVQSFLAPELRTQI